MRRYVLALDPGMITGIAFLDRSNFQTFGAAEYNFPETGGMIKRMAQVYGFDLDLVAEPYKIDKAQAPWSLEVIGVARYFSQAVTGQDLITKYGRSPGFCTDERLKALGWHRPGKRNANSATRQLLIHLVVSGWWDDRLGPKIEQVVDTFST